MAYAAPRSMNASLSEGMTDGKYKQVRQNVANAEPSTYLARRDLDDVWYGIHEAKVKVAPDLLQHADSPDFVATPLANPDAI